MTFLRLGIETVGGTMTKLIGRNKKSQHFRYIPRQPACVNILMTKDKHLLVKFEIDGIPLAP